MKNKKSKFVLFSVIGLAAISIGTVGFATWITGVDNRTANDTVTVNVDTSKNKTVIVEAALSEDDKTLSLTEPTTNIDQLIKVEGGSPTDLTVTFSSFRVVVGDAYTLNSISFTLEGTTIENCTISSDNLSIYPKNLYGEVDNTTTKLSYLKITKSIYDTETSLKPITSGQSGYIDGYTCYTLKEMAFTFSWGTMFGNGSQTPSTYLSTCSEAQNLSTEAKLAYVEKCNKMLNAMHFNLHNKNLTLTITANVTPTGA